MKVQQIIDEYTTKDNREITVKFSTDVESYRTINEQWVVHQLTAYIAGEPAGYLKISYIPLARWNKKFPSLLNFFMSTYFPSGKETLNWRQLSQNEKQRLLYYLVTSFGRNIRHPKWRSAPFYRIGPYEQETMINSMDDKELNVWLSIADNPKINKERAEDYIKSKNFHVDKPLVDFIRVHPEFARQHVALAMYREASKWLYSEFGLYLHASGVQSEEAVHAWTKMESLGWVIPALDGSSRKIIDPARID